MANEVKALDLQVRDAEGDRVAGFFYAEDAARFVGGFDGFKITHMRRVVWTEGSEDFSASESFDKAAAVIHSRM